MTHATICGSARKAVAVGEVTCAFCRGRGIDPFDIMSSRSACCVCGGSGKVRVGAPTVSCAHCRGTGAIGTLTCTTCGGKGVVSQAVLPIDPCPACHGTGDDASAPAMACLKCQGRGWVTGSEVQGFRGSKVRRDGGGDLNPTCQPGTKELQNPAC